MCFNIDLLLEPLRSILEFFSIGRSSGTVQWYACLCLKYALSVLSDPRIGSNRQQCVYYSDRLLRRIAHAGAGKLCQLVYFSLDFLWI